jgi:hypothetical protein
MELTGIDSYQTLRHYKDNAADAIVESQLQSMERKLKAV